MFISANKTFVNSPISSDRSSPHEEWLPWTIKGCTEELDKVNASIAMLSKRSAKLIARLRHLQQNSTEERSLSQLLAIQSSLDNITSAKERRMSTISDISAISRIVSGIVPNTSDAQNGEWHLCSPLITALKTLQLRRGQKRGVKM